MTITITTTNEVLHREVERKQKAHISAFHCYLLFVFCAVGEIRKEAKECWLVVAFVRRSHQLVFLNSLSFFFLEASSELEVFFCGAASSFHFCVVCIVLADVEDFAISRRGVYLRGVSFRYCRAEKTKKNSWEIAFQ